MTDDDAGTVPLRPTLACAAAPPDHRRKREAARLAPSGEKRNSREQRPQRRAERERMLCRPPLCDGEPPLG